MHQAIRPFKYSSNFKIKIKTFMYRLNLLLEWNSDFKPKQHTVQNPIRPEKYTEAKKKICTCVYLCTLVYNDIFYVS